MGVTALALVALLTFARYPALFTRGSEYKAAFRSVSGLNIGDEVRYGGLLVGSITGLEIDSADHTRILATFRVRRQTPVRTDTRASITQVGLLGQPFLNLAAGSGNAARLVAGSRVRSEESLSFQDAMSRLALFLERADTLLVGVERFAGSSPWTRIDRTLSRIDHTFAEAGTGSERVFAQLEAASLRLNELLAQAERVVATVDTTVQKTSPQVATASQEATETLREMRTLVRDLREALVRGDRLDEITRDIGVASDNLARISERLERDPSSLLKRRSPPQKPAGPQPRD